MKWLHGVHWATPATMVSALLAGCLLSLGHHLFYAGLAGGTAPTGEYSIAGTNISKQQFNTAVGTTFAFLVKATLALAVSVAYIQAFWRSAKVSRKGQRLSTLDTKFSILGNVIGLTKVHIWVKYPLLFVLAIIAWSIPIASIITPATLSVQTALTRPSALVNVPQFDFTNYDFVTPLGVGGTNGTNYTEYCYRGPGQLVERVATAVGAQGQILPITPPSTNASWSLDFWGPSLKCNSVEGQDREDIWASVWNFIAKDAEQCSQSYGYIAWAPTAEDQMPFVRNGSSNSSYVLQTNDLTLGAAASVYVAVIPGMLSHDVAMATHTITSGCVLWELTKQYANYSQALAGTQDTGGDSVASFFNGSTLLQCQFLNTSYTAAFDYVNGAQVVDVSKVAYDKSPALVPADCVTGPMAITNGGDMELADTYEANKSCSTLNMVGKQCEFDPNLVRTLAYQGIAEAFGELVQGTVGLGGPNLPFPAVTYNSNVAKTVLLDTIELSFFQTWSMDDMFWDLASLSELSNGTDYIGLSDTRNVTSRGPLATALEDMFENITLSLLSEQYLQPNYSSPYAPSPLVNVTYQNYHNVYSYASRTLWIAYGTAIAFTTLAVAIGIAALMLNGASYNNNFSTVLRISRSTRMNEEIQENEGDGSEPLPKHLARARVLISKGRDGGPEKSSGSSFSSSVTMMDEPHAAAHTSLLRADTRRTM